MEELIIRSEQDVARMVNDRPAGRSSWLIILTALGGIFVDAYDFSSLGIGIPQLVVQLHLTPTDVGTVTAIASLGGCVGAFWGGPWTDKIGRFRMALLDMVILTIGAVGSALALNMWMLLFFRFMLGVGVGLDVPVALAFLAEYSSERRKGVVNVWQPVWYIATAFMGLLLLPFYYMPSFNPHLWRVAVGFGAIPAVIVLILRYKFMQESPTWAAHNLGLQEAGRILAETYKIRVTVIPDAVQALPKSKVGIRELLVPAYRKRLLLTSCTAVMGAIEYYTVGFNLPSISIQLFGALYLYAILGAIFFNLFGIVGGCGAVWQTRHLGLRKMIIIGFGIEVLSVIGLWQGGRFPVLIQALFVASFIFGHSFGVAANTQTMAALSFPTRIRATAVGFIHALIRLGAIGGFYYFPLFMAKAGLRKMMMWLVLVPLTGLIVTLMIKWEPVGKDIEAEDTALRQKAAAAGSDGKSRLAGAAN